MSIRTNNSVRMKDIAADIGVSVITVSKVLRNQGRISAAVREKVLQRAQELNYQPNQAARALATGQTNLVGMIIPDLMHPFFTVIAKMTTKNLREKGYGLIIASSEEDPKLELAEIAMMAGRGVDVLILASSESPKSSELRKCLETLNVPLLLLDRPLRGVPAPFVGSNNQAIGELATEYLIERGYRRIAYIGLENLSVGKARLRGYQSALAKHGLPAPTNHVVFSESVEDGYKAMQTLLKLHPLPDAVFCMNDILAGGAQRAIFSKGLAIPGDIAVIGVSNLTDTSQWINTMVPLTTIDQNIDELAASLTEHILNLLRTKPLPLPNMSIIPHKVVIRESA